MEDSIPFGSMWVLGPLLHLCLHSIRHFYFDMLAILHGLGEGLQIFVYVSRLLEGPRGFSDLVLL